MSEMNGRPPAVWSSAVAPGGYVCAVADPTAPDGICGMPVESEPCDRHDGTELEALRAENAALRDLLAAVGEALDVPVPDDDAAADAAYRRVLTSRMWAARAATAAGYFPVREVVDFTARLRGRIQDTPATYPTDDGTSGKEVAG